MSLLFCVAFAFLCFAFPSLVSLFISLFRVSIRVSRCARLVLLSYLFASSLPDGAVLSFLCSSCAADSPPLHCCVATRALPRGSRPRVVTVPCPRHPSPLIVARARVASVVARLCVDSFPSLCATQSSGGAVEASVQRVTHTCRTVRLPRGGCASRAGRGGRLGVAAGARGSPTARAGCASHVVPVVVVVVIVVVVVVVQQFN